MSGLSSFEELGLNESDIKRISIIVENCITDTSTSGDVLLSIYNLSIPEYDKMIAAYLFGIYHMKLSANRGIFSKLLQGK